MGAREPTRAERGEQVFIGHGGRRPRVLAHGGYADRWLAADERHLYWTDSGSGEITRLPKDGGVPMVLAQARRPKHLLLADGFLYWVQSDPDDARSYDDPPTGSVVRMPVGGGATEVVLAELEGPEHIAVSGRDIAVTCFGDWNYGGEKSQGLVVRGTLGSPRARVIATKQRWPQSILFVGDDLFWLNHGLKRPNYFADGAVMRTRREGSRKRWVVHKDQSMASSLVADDEHLYWTTAATIFEPYRPGVIYKRPRGGGPSRRLVTWSEESGRIALDATHVYWLSHARGRMYRVRKDGGEPELMVSTPDNEITICENLVVDDRRVYWCAHSAESAGGAVFSIAKEPVGARATEVEPAAEEAPN